MRTETLDKVYLEWSQFTTARTARELAYDRSVRELIDAASEFTPQSDSLKIVIADALLRQNKHGDAT